MADAQERSPRAEIARAWLWTAFGVQWVIGVVLDDWWGMDFLGQGWWLIPRYALTATLLIAGGIWGWETYQRRKKEKAVVPNPEE